MIELKDIVPLTLGYDSQKRKDAPFLATVIGYFTAALKGVAEHCVRSNQKHNPGEPVHWARGKSTDHDECVFRHGIDTMEIRAWLRRNPTHPERSRVVRFLLEELDAKAWRSLAESQEAREEFDGAPLSAASVVPTFDPVKTVATPTGVRPLQGPAGADWRENPPTLTSAD
jgi:hypothetical protein